MGTTIEINDTLKISTERGFPVDLTLEAHCADPASSDRFVGMEFSFVNKGERLYHRPPTRVFLVQEMADRKWLYWGHALVLEQTLRDGKTEGRYRIIKIYDPDYQRLHTLNEAPQGKSYF